MAFSRNKAAAAVAATLSLAVLTGCPGPTTPVPSTGTSASPSTGASAVPSTGASTGASTDPSASPSTGASGSPTTGASASAPAPSGRTVILSGNVYDEEGATVDGALITVRSLDASVPYTATATSAAGSYVVNNVPEGANVEIIATKDGFTERRRVGSFQQQQTGRRNLINFGAAGGQANNDAEDSTGEAYFISDYPEVEMTSPGQDDSNVDVTKLTYKLTFSEPLTEDSRDNIVDMFRIFPANGAANSEDNDDSVAAGTTLVDGNGTPGTNTIADLELLGDLDDNDAADGAENVTITAPDNNGAGVPYSLAENDSFLGSTSNKVRASWNADGTEVTFTFNGGLLASDNEDAKYNVALVSLGADGDDKVEDEDGNQLGTNADGNLSSYEAAGELVFNAFKEEDLAINEATALSSNTAIRNWASTHDTAAVFEARRDTTDPKLTGVEVSEETEGTRIELTFSEPMAAFNDADGFVSDDLLVLRNYHFAVGEDRGDLDDTDLDGDEDGLITLGTTATQSFDGLQGNATANYDEEFTFAPNGGSVASNALPGEPPSTATVGQIYIEVDGDNPNTVFFWLAGATDFFNGSSQLKAYVEGISDPAGNEISDSDAEDNVVTTNL